MQYVNRLSALVLVGFVAIFSAGYMSYANDSLPTIDTALADCVAIAPTLETRSEQVVPGGAFKIHGEDFGELVECDDTSVPGDEDVGVQVEPSKNISIGVKQGSRTWELATVDADQDLAFDEKLKLPAEVGSGKATVIAKGTQGSVKESISVVKSATSGSLAQPEDGELPKPPPAYEVKPNGDIRFGGDVTIVDGCDRVANSGAEGFPNLTEKEFQDVAAKCAELDFSTADGGQYAGDDATGVVTDLPDTGGFHLPLLAGGLILIVGGLLLKRRMS